MRPRALLLALANKYVYSPLVGLTRTVAPSGTTADYAYDSANRLVSIRRNGTEIQTVSYRIGQDADNRVTVSDVIRGNSKHVRLSHFDGLGRLIKTTDSSTGVSVSRKYDAMGRLYGESAPGRDVAQDSNWTVNAYEPSPRGRLTSTTKPGKAWHDGNKRVLSRMYANTSSGALSLSCYVASGSAVVRNGLYAAGVLTVEETVDEDGHYSRKFTDKHGLTVGTAEGVAGQMLTTLYVYDDYDRLLYILPPGMTNSTYSSTSLAEQAYSYKYDAFGRMVESRVPGCAPAKFRYSRAGRLVAEHPAAMADGKWLLHFYDRAGREVLSSVASPTEAQLQSLCDTLRTASYFGYNLYGGYKFSKDLPCDIGQIQKATYYDGYSFVTRTDADFGFDASACPFNRNTTLARGLVAGETDYSQGLDPAPGTVYVYDADGRVVRQYAMLRRGRHALVRTFDTAGNVLTEDESLCNGTTPHISRHTDNTYDSAGRLSYYEITENGVKASVKKYYGMNGLLSFEEFGNGVDRAYKYDVHGWPTSNTIGLAPLTLPTIPAGTLSAT